MSEDSQNEVKIIENYRNWQPSINAGIIVRRLIDTIPVRYLIGLHSIVLTNSSGLNHQQRHTKTKSRGKKVAISSALGSYHQAFRGKPATIELFVDNIVNHSFRKFLWIPFFRDFAFAQTVFHELGHHLHVTQAREFKEKEDVADKWARKLSVMYFRRQHSYLLPIAWVWRYIFDPIAAWVKKHF